MAVFAAAALLVSISQSALFAQNQKSTGTQQTTQQQTAAVTDETQLPITTEGGGTNVSGVRSPNGVWVFIRMILVLALVILIIWLVFKLMKKNMAPGTDNDPFLRKVSQVTVSPGKTVQIVTLLDHAYLIGVGEDSINLLGTIDDKELIDAMNLYADKHSNTTKPRSFADILDIFMPNGPRSKEKPAAPKTTKKVYDGSTEQVLNMLKKQRDRLNKEENE